MQVHLDRTPGDGSDGVYVAFKGKWLGISETVPLSALAPLELAVCSEAAMPLEHSVEPREGAGLPAAAVTVASPVARPDAAGPRSRR